MRPARGLSFGAAAERYERYRPGYPDEVVDAVLAHARRPVLTAVEVGAGTGKATRLFAARGVHVTALEPDAAMARVLLRTTRGLPVRPEPVAYEQLRADRPADLLYAAAAWHWTDPATRWARAVDHLSPGGVLALFGRPADLLAPDLAAAVEQVERQHLPDTGAAGHPWTIEEAAAVDGLEDAVQRDLPAVLTTSAEEYVGRLSTASAYLLLDPGARARALCAVRAVLPERVELDGTVRLSLARRR